MYCLGGQTLLTCGKCVQKLGNGVGPCTSQQDLGGQCANNGDCLSGWCDGGILNTCTGTCKSKRADGSYCGYDAECASGNCKNADLTSRCDGTCGLPPAVSSRTHFSATMRPCWLRRAVRDVQPRHRAGVASMAWSDDFRTGRPRVGRATRTPTARVVVRIAWAGKRV